MLKMVIGRVSISIILLFFIAVGYAQDVPVASQDTTTDLITQYSFTELLDLKVVTAEKHEQKLKEVPASMVVMTRADIARYGFRSYTELLQHITGYYLIDDYYYLGSKNFGVRGFFSTGAFSNVVVLVNGVSQLSDEYQEYPDTKITVPIEAIERIEVVRGPMSVIYGNGAFFGAINIITDNYQQPDTSSVATIGYGSANTWRSAAHITGGSDKFHYTVSAGYSQTDGLSVPFTDLTSDTALIRYANLAPDATTKGMMEDKRKYAGINMHFDDFYFDFSYNETRTEVIDGLPSYGKGSELSSYATNAMLGYQRAFNEHVSTRVQTGYYMHNHFLNYEKYKNYNADLDAKKTSAYDVDINLFFQWKPVNVLLGAYHRNVLDLLQIADFSYENISRADGEIGMPRDETYTTNALYLQATVKPFEKLTLVGGARLEHVDAYQIYYTRGLAVQDTSVWPGQRTEIFATHQPANNGWVVTPRLAAIYSPLPRHQLKFLYGKATKQPAFLEILRQVLQQTPPLHEQTIETFEFNYNGLFHESVHHNFSLFYNRLDDLITSTNEYSPETGWNIYSANSGTMETMGAELSLQWQPLPGFLTNVSATYQQTQNKKAGYENIPVAYSPHWLGYARVSYSPWKHSTVSVLYRYVGQMHTVWQTETLPEEGQRLSTPASGYNIWDLHIRQEQIAGTGLFAHLKINNLLNQEIRYPTTPSNGWIDKGTLGTGFAIFGGVGFEF